jgi:hypothetical protein
LFNFKTIIVRLETKNWVKKSSIMYNFQKLLFAFFFHDNDHYQRIRNEVISWNVHNHDPVIDNRSHPVCDGNFHRVCRKSFRGHYQK